MINLTALENFRYLGHPEVRLFLAGFAAMASVRLFRAGLRWFKRISIESHAE